MALACWGLFSGQKTASPAPVPLEAQLMQGQHLWQNGYYDSAYAVYQRVWRLAADQKNVNALAGATRHRGKYLARFGFPEAAEVALDSVIALADQIGPQNPHIILARLERADLEARKGQIDECMRQFRVLVKDAEALPPNDSLRPTIYLWAAQAYPYIEAYDTALTYAQRAGKLFGEIFPAGKLDIAYVENTLGSIYYAMDRLEQSAFHARRSAEMLSQLLRPDHSQVVQGWNNVALLNRSLGLNWEALEVFQKNLAHFDQLSPNVQFSALYNYATTLVMVGDYEGALPYLDRAEALIRERPGLYPNGLNLVLYEQAAAHESLLNFDLALPKIGLAIEEDLRLHGPRHTGLVQDYLRKGTILEKMGRLQAAEAAMLQARDLANRVLDPGSFRRGWVYESLGETQIKLGRPADAIANLKVAVAISQGYGLKWGLTDVYRGIAEAWLVANEPDSNLHYLQKAWENALPEQPFTTRPDARIHARWAVQGLPSLVLTLANGMDWRYRKSGNLTYAHDALACYERVIALTDSQRLFHEGTSSQQTLTNEQAPVIAQALNLCADLFAATSDPQFIDRAFILAERNKARRLRDHLRGQYALKFSQIPDSLVAKEQYYRQRLALLEQTDPGEVREQEEEKVNRLEAARLHQAYQGFLRRLETEYPQYYQLKYPDKNFTAQAMLNLLPDGEAVYSYFQAENQTYVFRLFEGQIKLSVVSAGLDSSLSRWLAFVRTPPGGQTDLTAAAADAHRLAVDLLPDLGPEVRRVHIVPSGRLALLPFESLLLEPAAGNDLRTWPFLAKKIPVMYAPAAEIWLRARTESPKQQAAAYLGFAPDFSTGSPALTRDGLGALRFNLREVEEAADALGGTAWTGPQASESRVKAVGGSPVILHFATHALAESDRPMESRLYFSAQDSTEDGALYAREVYGLKLNSPLTVLSACQTAMGPLVQGEGVMSLARSFQYAGSQQVLTTLWQADDASGAEVVSSFFSHLRQNLPAAEAMARARTDWLAQADAFHHHPYYWAGFVLIGDGAPVPVKTPWPAWIWAVSISVLSLAVGGLLFFRKKVFPPNPS